VALISVAVVSVDSEIVDAAARKQAELALQQTRHELVAAHLHGGEAGKAYAAARIAYSTTPGSPLARRDLAESLQGLGDQRKAAGSLSEAIGFYKDALTQYEALALANPFNPGTQRDVMNLANLLGATQMDAGEIPAAISSYSRALQITEGLAAMEGSQVTTGTREEVAAANRRVGELLLGNGARDAGLGRLRKALEIYRQLRAGPEVAEVTDELAQ
jgi:tetratricopeptide (TPR) repeat protein